MLYRQEKKTLEIQETKHVEQLSKIQFWCKRGTTYFISLPIIFLTNNLKVWRITMLVGSDFYINAYYLLIVILSIIAIPTTREMKPSGANTTYFNYSLWHIHKTQPWPLQCLNLWCKSLKEFMNQFIIRWLLTDTIVLKYIYIKKRRRRIRKRKWRFKRSNFSKKHLFLCPGKLPNKLQ